MSARHVLGMRASSAGLQHEVWKGNKGRWLNSHTKSRVQSALTFSQVFGFVERPLWPLKLFNLRVLWSELYFIKISLPAI